MGFLFSVVLMPIGTLMARHKWLFGDKEVPYAWWAAPGVVVVASRGAGAAGSMISLSCFHVFCHRGVLDAAGALLLYVLVCPRDQGPAHSRE